MPPVGYDRSRDEDGDDRGDPGGAGGRVGEGAAEAGAADAGGDGRGVRGGSVGGVDVGGREEGAADGARAGVRPGARRRRTESSMNGPGIWVPSGPGLPCGARELGGAGDGRVWLDVCILGQHLPQMYRPGDLNELTAGGCARLGLCPDCLGFGDLHPAPAADMLEAARGIDELRQPCPGCRRHRPARAADHPGPRQRRRPGKHPAAGTRVRAAARRPGPGAARGVRRTGGLVPGVRDAPGRYRTARRSAAHRC
jgi:hypothetical protein